MNWENNINSTLYEFQIRYKYVLENLSGIQKLKGLIRAKSNIQALKLKYFNSKNVIKEEFGIWLLLIPFSLVFKKVRFKEKRNKYDT